MSLRTRRVLLRVANVSWLADYHGREAGLVGETVDALELDTGDHVAYVDDRDGEASMLMEALSNVAASCATGRLASSFETRARKALMDHAQRRCLHGEVRGVRAGLAA